MIIQDKQFRYIPPKPRDWFTVSWCGSFGAIIGFLSAQGNFDLVGLYILLSMIIFGGLSFLIMKVTRKALHARIFCATILGILGFSFFGLPFSIMMIFLGLVVGSVPLWLSNGDYRLPLPPYASEREVLWFYAFRGICGLVFLFLIIPILILVPLSFNQEPYFSFTEGMLNFDKEAYSLRWYWDILANGMSNPDAVEGWWSDMWANAQWVRSIKNSFFIGFWATILATGLGTLAAIGLSRSEMPYRRPIMALLISPMIVPLVVTASGLFYFFSQVGLAKNYTGLILAHAVLGTPFVIITVTATLVGFDQSLTRASASLGAGPIRTFFKVQTPLILPGVISGALFAFITSFDEVVVVLQLADVRQRTIPRQMFSGIREQISPTILAVATILVLLSIILLTIVEMLRRRSERLRGITN